MYNIAVTFETGNSFGLHTETEIIELGVSLEVAKANLKRIKAHYEMYKQMEYNKHIPNCLEEDWFVYKEVLWSLSKDTPIYKEHKHLYQEWDLITQPDWFTAQQSIYLYLDNGNKIQISCFWVGYFETLQNIKIVAPIDEDYEFDF